MEKVKRVSSTCGKKSIDIMQGTDGIYSLRKYVTKYDSEEEKSYEIRELPDPSGKFSDLYAAVNEAKLALR